MSPHVQALIFTAAVALVFALGFGTALWLDVSARIDEATRLPQCPPATADEPPTERIAAANVIDIRRPRTTFEETA